MLNIMHERIKQYIDMCEKAFLNGSFIPLFCGTEGFSVGNKNVPADVPTDWAVIINFGIYDYYIITKDNKIITMCYNGIMELLNGGAFELWCAYNLCFFMIKYEYENRAPFHIMDKNMINNLKLALNKNIDCLRKAKIWNGKNLIDGLWTDIVTSSKVLKMRYDIEIIEETNLKIKDLLKKVLDCYFSEYKKQFGDFPKTVKTKDICVPHIDAEVGEWGTWRPELPQSNVPIEVYSKFYGKEFPKELYEFISCWRFAPFEFKKNNFIYTINAIYEDHLHRPNVLMSIAVKNTLYYLLGTAISEESEKTYGIFFKSTGGIYLIEDGTNQIQFLDDNISNFLLRGVLSSPK